MVPEHRNYPLKRHFESGLQWMPDMVARHLRVDRETALEIGDYVHTDPNPREAVKFQVRALALRWQCQANEAREVLTRLTSTD